MAYGDFNNLPKKTAADKVLHNKAFNIAKNEKYDGNQRGLTSIVYNFFDKRTEGWVKSNNTQNNEIVEELRKPIIGRFRKP